MEEVKKLANQIENMLQKRSDLHLHSTNSDGDLTPTELVKHMKQKGLEVIALTDHDTTSGVEEAIQVGKQYGIEVIPGVEITTKHNKRSIHLLGYYINISDEKFNKTLEKIRSWREVRMRKILENLNYEGIILSYEEVTKHVKGSVSKRHIAKAMIEKGYVNSVQEATQKYLKKGKVGYVEVNSVSTKEAVKLVLESGGMPVIAHPGTKKVNEEWIEELTRDGLKGLEVYNPKHGQEQISYYKNLAKKYSLIITKGSDFHG